MNATAVSFLATMIHAQLYQAVITQVGGFDKFSKDAKGIIHRRGAFTHGLSYNSETVEFVDKHFSAIMAKVREDADCGLYESIAEYISNMDGLEGLQDSQIEHAIEHKSKSPYYLLVWEALAKTIVVDVATDLLQYQSDLVNMAEDELTA